MSQIVELRVSDLQVLSILQVVDVVVKRSFRKEATLREQDVIELEIPIIRRKFVRRESVVKGEVELRQGEDHILVEEVQYDFGIPEISHATVLEYHPPQESEFA